MRTCVSDNPLICWSRLHKAFCNQTTKTKKNLFSDFRDMPNQSRECTHHALTPYTHKKLMHHPYRRDAVAALSSCDAFTASLRTLSPRGGGAVASLNEF